MKLPCIQNSTAIARSLVVLMAFVLCSVPVFAQEEAEPEEERTNGWKANAVVNGQNTTGNAESFSVGGNSLVSKKFQDNEVSWTSEGAYGRAQTSAGDSETNVNNWKTALRYDRYLSDTVTLFALSSIGRNKPAGFDWRYGGALGASHFLIKNDNTTFKYEGGYDYSREVRVANDNAHIHSARLFLALTHNLNESVYLGQDVETLFNLVEGEDVRINTLTTFNVRMTTDLSLQLAYSVRFDNQPVAGFEKTDTQAQVGLNVTFL